MKIQEQISLKNHTTFKIGGNARYFFEAESLEDVIEAIRFAKNQVIPFFILGGGSNTLFVSPSFDGVVIKIDIKRKEFKDIGGSVFVSVGAGEIWDEFVSDCVGKNLFGIENLSAIPGKVGAAPIQNIGAYGTEVKNTIHSVEFFDIKNEVTRVLSKEDCLFGYRDSFFKTSEGRNFLITGVNFLLKKEGNLNFSYKDVANYFETNDTEPTLKSMRKAIIEIRKGKFPDIKSIGTAGSFFKNPIIDLEHYSLLVSRFKGIPGIPFDSHSVKVPAGWLVERVGGFKGVRYGDVGVWENQALVLVNFGHASGQEILSLSKKIQEKVKSDIGITIEPEVVII